MSAERGVFQPMAARSLAAKADVGPAGQDLVPAAASGAAMVALNEDAWGQTATRLWVIDGATGVTDRRCTRSASDPAWLAETASALLARPAFDDLPMEVLLSKLEQGLRRAFENELAADPGRRESKGEGEAKSFTEIEMPSAALGLVQCRGGELEIACVADITVVVQAPGGPLQIYSDHAVERFAQTSLALWKETALLPAAERWQMARRTILHNRRAMNQPDGYRAVHPTQAWAADTPVVRVPWVDGMRVLLASDGLWRLVDLFEVLAPQNLLEQAAAQGFDELLAQLRRLERADPDGHVHLRVKCHDDATGLWAMVRATQGNPVNACHALGLGLDAGGTATRWALVDASGQVRAQGQGDGLHGIATTDAQRSHIVDTLRAIAAAARVHGAPTAVVAGVTGMGNDAPTRALFQDALAQGLGLPPDMVTVCNDIQTAFLSVFAPGEGHLVYAGTGSVGAHIDAAGVLHRVGGRGALIDDGGGGFWIAKEALRRVWRQEENEPGRWRSSPLAQRLFDAVGGSTWDATRLFVYTRERGDVGRLALHVAASAQDDAIAREVLLDAGAELARLAQVLLRRHGPLPVVLSGGAAHLHPLILQGLNQALDHPVRLVRLQAAHGAARIAVDPDRRRWHIVQAPCP